MRLKSYQKYIAPGKGFLIFSILFALIVRLGYLLHTNDSIVFVDTDTGHLWRFIAPYFNNSIISVLVASISIAAIAFVLSYINDKHILIREKTILPAAFSIFMFSFQPSFLAMSPYYLAILFLLWALSSLYSSYQTNDKSPSCANIGFLIAMASLFITPAILYLPVFWIGFSMMRTFSIKSIFSSLFGVFIVYIPIFFCYWYVDNADGFFQSIAIIDFDTIKYLPLFSFSAIGWTVVSVILLFLIIIIANSYLNSYKDKIKIRAYIAFLSTVALYSLLLYLFLNVDITICLYMLVVIGSLLLAHFFTLVSTRSGVYLFYFFLICCFFICYIAYFV